MSRTFDLDGVPEGRLAALAGVLPHVIAFMQNLEAQGLRATADLHLGAHPTITVTVEAMPVARPGPPEPGPGPARDAPAAAEGPPDDTAALPGPAGDPVPEPAAAPPAAAESPPAGPDLLPGVVPAGDPDDGLLRHLRDVPRPAGTVWTLAADAHLMELACHDWSAGDIARELRVPPAAVKPRFDRLTGLDRDTRTRAFGREAVRDALDRMVREGAA